MQEQGAETISEEARIDHENPFHNSFMRWL